MRRSGRRGQPTPDGSGYLGVNYAAWVFVRLFFVRARTKGLYLGSIGQGQLLLAVHTHDMGAARYNSGGSIEGDGEMEVTRSMLRRARRLQAGLCAQCGTAEHKPDRTRCEDCLMMCRALSAARRRLANRLGKCQACLRRAQAPGRGRRCKRCADFYLAAQSRRARERRAAERARKTHRTRSAA